jgi:malonyl-CoA/methylmalonyl-CoA synthetase
MLKAPLIDLIKGSLDRFGPCRALTFLKAGEVETRLSFADLDEDSDRLAKAFSGQGLEPGDRAVLYLPKSVAFVVAHLAVQKVGAVGVPLNPAFKEREAAYFFEAAAPKLAVVGTEQAAVARRIGTEARLVTYDPGLPYARPQGPAGFQPARPPVLEDPAILLFTSGTTGRPKGAILSQGNLSHDAQNVARVWEMGPSDVLCHGLPLFHAHGLCYALHTALLSGVGLVMLDAFDPEVVLRVLAQKEGELASTLFMAVPTMYARLLERPPVPGDFTHLRLMTSGSAPLPVRDFERIRSFFGHEPVEREGMSETGMNFSNPLHGPRKAGSIGLPLPDLEVRVADPVRGKDVPAGQVGELWLRGPSITPGYWRMPAETEAAFDQGWFLTGDLGRRDEDGYYFLTDRLKHVIISGGENVSPVEIEQVIQMDEEVVETAVVGVPDDTWGERVVAAVVLRPGSVRRAEEIQDFCREHLLNWKCPKEVRVVETLPRNAMGKVLKDRVRDLF